MKAGELAVFFGKMDPNSEVRVATAAHGEPLVESIITTKSFGGYSVILQCESFVNEMERRYNLDQPAEISAKKETPAVRKLRLVQ